MSREKGLEGCTSCLCVLLESAQKSICSGLGTSGVASEAVWGCPQSHQWPSQLHQTSWSGGLRSLEGGESAFVRMEITVSPIQSVALFPGDNCKTGLLVLKNS